MKPFHYNQDPLYAAAASILEGKTLTEQQFTDVDVAGDKFTYKDRGMKILHRTDGPAVERSNGTKEWYVNGKLHRSNGPAVEWPSGTKEWYVNGKLHRSNGPAIEWSSGTKEWYADGKRHRTDGPAIERSNGSKEWYVNGKLHRADGPAIERSNGSKEWYLDDKRFTEKEFTDASMTKKKQHDVITEKIVAFKNLGFKHVNGLMLDDEIHAAVNSTIKGAANKLSDSTWDVVTDIYGKLENGAWTGDWILKRKGGSSWLTIKDGGPFHAHEDISSVLSFFKIEESMKDNDFKSLIGNQVLHGSPEYPTKEIIASITPHQTKKGSFEVEFKSGAFDVLSQGELYDLMNGVEVFYKSPHGGRSVIELQEDENPSSAKHMIANQLETIIRNSKECLTMIEDDQQFPEWAQSKIAVAEHGIVDVTEYMNSHANKIEKDDNMDESTPFKMGTAIITAPGHKLDGKQANIFHKYDDGRINVQYAKSDKKGDVINITLNKGQYKLKENQSLTEQTFSKDALKSILNTMETQSFYDWYEKDFTDYITGDADGKTQEEILDDLSRFFN